MSWFAKLFNSRAFEGSMHPFFSVFRCVLYCCQIKRQPMVKMNSLLDFFKKMFDCRQKLSEVI